MSSRQPPAGVVLAAGEGRRLRPLTGLRPKALCPVAGRALLDLALDRIAPITGLGPERLAVNANHLAEQVFAHCAARVTVSWERGDALGTAGALGALRDWLAGRDVLVTNADSYLPAGLAGFSAGWDGERCRLLCLPATGQSGRADFEGPDGVGRMYIGACLLPWTAVRGLQAEPSGLYEVLWRSLARRGKLDLVTPFTSAVTPTTITPTPGPTPTPGEAGEATALAEYVAIDCGTPADYLAANLHASGGANVVAAGAVVLGRLERCVVWDGAWVGPDEHLVDAIRAGDAQHPVTVRVGSPDPPMSPTRAGSAD